MGVVVNVRSGSFTIGTQSWLTRRREFFSPHMGKTREKVTPFTIRVTTRVVSHPLHTAGSCVLSQGRPCEQNGSRAGFIPPTGCLVSIINPPMLYSFKYHRTGWTMVPSGDADPNSFIRTRNITHNPLPPPNRRQCSYTQKVYLLLSGQTRSHKQRDAAWPNPLQTVKILQPDLRFSTSVRYKNYQLTGRDNVQLHVN